MQVPTKDGKPNGVVEDGVIIIFFSTTTDGGNALIDKTRYQLTRSKLLRQHIYTYLTR